MTLNEALVCLGVFAVMALSNAVVPVLSDLADGTTAEGFLYSAYFFGAFIMTLPAGLLSDRTDPVRLIQAGLLMTCISGAALVLAPGSFIISLFFRFFEGLAGGLFISSALAWVNEQTYHEKLSGTFMALLNGGLIAGLLVTGWLVETVHNPLMGLAFFTLVSGAAFLCGLMLKKGTASPREFGCFPEETLRSRLARIGRRYRWLWISGIILMGASGVVTALYPGFTGASPTVLAAVVSAMNIATMVTVIVVSRMQLPPIPSIRVSAVILALAMILCTITPAGFVLVGIALGITMISQMAFLAENEVQQGTVMGVFNTASYCGMTIFPPAAAFVAENSGFLSAFFMTGAVCVVAALVVGRCDACETAAADRTCR